MAIPTQEEIDALESAIRSGTRTFTIGDMQIGYRDLKEMQTVLRGMKEEHNANTGLFSVINVNYSKGL